MCQNHTLGVLDKNCDSRKLPLEILMSWWGLRPQNQYFHKQPRAPEAAGPMGHCRKFQLGRLARECLGNTHELLVLESCQTLKKSWSKILKPSWFDIT